MSKLALSDPKVALGISGAVIVIAVAASAGLSAFVSDDEAEANEIEVVESDEKPSSPAEPAKASGWADSGASDDWGAADDAAGGEDGGWGAPAATSQPRAAEPSIASKNSELTPGGNARGNASGSQAPARAARGGSRPNVTSGASPDAPAIEPPGGAGELVEG